MPIVEIGELKVGMIVAETILVNNRMVLGQGTELTEKILKLLKTWGVTKVNITKDSPVEEKEEIVLSSQQMAEINKQSNYKFKFTDKNDEVLQEMKRLMIKRRVKVQQNTDN